MTSPQSCTATILLTVTIPVSVSTETSAIWTPPTPLLVRSGVMPLLLTPRAVTGIAPSFAQACFQERLLPGFAATRTVPLTASSSSGLEFNAGATFAKSWFSASIAPRRVEEETPPIVVEPPEPPEGGYCVSPIWTLTASNGTPSDSAATIWMQVRVPVPRSCDPSLTSTEPSGWIVKSFSLLWPRPPQVWNDIPMPRLTGPDPGSGRGCQFFFQPMSSSALW